MVTDFATHVGNGITIHILSAKSFRYRQFYVLNPQIVFKSITKFAAPHPSWMKTHKGEASGGGTNSELAKLGVFSKNNIALVSVKQSKRSDFYAYPVVNELT